MKVVVEIVAYDKDTHGEEDGSTKEFSTLREALDYVFDDLEDEIVEIYKDEFGRYVFRPKDYDEYYDVEYIIEVCE